ncbi:MAG: hypothetical protein LBR88_06695 [Zoogloeaceae bacterium]|jgi:hypothetical protein|nr:hypothetical protein [Zoogloeaceae bacterium]
MIQNSSFKDLKVAIIPHPRLGDTTIGLRLAWIFSHAGSCVCFYSNSMCSTHEYFPWLDILPNENLSLLDISPRYDLVICHVKNFPQSNELAIDCLQLDNIAYLKSKNSKDGFELGRQKTLVRGHLYPGANRIICPDSKSGLSMVQWIDQYAHEVFGLSCPDPVPVQFGVNQKSTGTKVVIFPTSAKAEKDYPLRAWMWLANRLTKDGWMVDFVCLPKEQATIQKICANFAVRSFPSIKELMDYLSDCTAVISNDSGGGHLASLMGKKTFTITRRKKNFSWRPDFNDLGYVLSPLITFRLFGCRRIWWPFIPIWRIPEKLEKPLELPSMYRQQRT